MNSIDDNFVSVVIPVFNSGKTLAETIESVLKQSYENYEIIIVDDGSTDNLTLEELQRLKTHPKVNLFIQSNSGPAVARNLGIKHAKGELIVCLDSDDLIAKNYLEKLVKAFEKVDEKIAIITTYLQAFGDSHEQWVFPPCNPQSIEEFKYTNLVHGASMFRKKAWREVGGYDADFYPGYEDWDFWLSIIEKGYYWQTIPEAIFYYRRRSGSLMSKTNNKRYLLDELFIKKHIGLYGGDSIDMIQQKMILVEQKRHQPLSFNKKIRHVFSKNFLKRFGVFR